MKSIIYFAVISILFASIGQVASDLYVPSLPAITITLHTTTSLAQITIFLYMIGFAISRLIYGPISDAIGRKKPLIFGLTFCLFGTIVCAVAPSITVLIIGRLLQGLGAGAGVVIGGAIVRDKLEGNDLAVAYSYMSIANVAMIGSAPLIGGYLQYLYGWRASFLFIVLYALVALIVSIFFLDETNKYIDRDNLTPKKLKENTMTLVTSSTFIIYGAFICLVYGGIIAWLTLGPVLLQNFINITPVGFGWIALIAAGCYGVGVFCNGRLVYRYGINKLLTFGTICLLISSAIMLPPALLHILNLWVILIPVYLFFFGASFIFPNAFAGALIPFAKLAGIAGAVLGFGFICGGILTSGLMALAPDNSQLPLALIFAAFSLIALFLLIKLPKQEPKHD